jgi:hypothetical protein
MRYQFDNTLFAATTAAAHAKDLVMNRNAWIGVIASGTLLSSLGLFVVEPALAPVSVMLLLTCGLLTCLAGALGLAGLIAWVPGFGVPEEAVSHADQALNEV